MQHRLVCPCTTQLGDYLPGFNVLPFLHQYLPVVCVGAQIMLVVVYNNEVAITQQPTTRVNHISMSCSLHSIPGFSGNINTFIDFPGCRISCNNGAIVRRSEEHTSELQSRPHLVCRLLLEKKK